MISFWFAMIYTVYYLGKILIDTFIYKNEKQASEDYAYWKLTAGNLLYCFLLEEINAYLIQN